MGGACSYSSSTVVPSVTTFDEFIQNDNVFVSMSTDIVQIHGELEKKEKFNQITAVELKWNHLGDQSVPLFFELSSDIFASLGRTLTSLSLIGNDISDAGVKHIVDLKGLRLTAMTTLDISCNCITEIGLLAIINVGLGHPFGSLTKLDCSANLICVVSDHQIMHALYSYPQLKTLVLDDNPMKSSHIRRIKKFMTSSEVASPVMAVLPVLFDLGHTEQLRDSLVARQFSSSCSNSQNTSSTESSTSESDFNTSAFFGSHANPLNPSEQSSSGATT